MFIGGICDAIIIYDVLHKRKIFLDAFAEGLEVFYLRTGIQAFPDLFQELFVAADTCSPDDVLGILKFQCDDSESSKIAGYLKSSIKKLDESGTKFGVCHTLAPLLWDSLKLRCL